MRHKLICFLVLLLASGAAQAQQWPTYRENPQGPAAYGAPGYYPPAPAPHFNYQGPYYIQNPYQQVQYNAGYAPPMNPPVPPGFYGPGPFPPGVAPNGYTGAPVPSPQAGQPGMPPQGMPPGMPPQAGPQQGMPPGMQPQIAPPGMAQCMPPEPVVTVSPEFFLPPELPDCAHHEPTPAPHDPRFDKEHLGWVSVDYQASWFRPDKLPGPLVTSGATTDVPPGAVGSPGTIPLFDTPNLDMRMLSGIRAELGLWLDCENHYSVEAGGFVVLPRRSTFTAASDANGNPVIVRPVFDVVNQIESVYLVAFPNIASGSSTVVTEAEAFGFEVNGSVHWAWSPRLQGSVLFGFRFVDLHESLQVTDSFQPLQTGQFRFLGQPVSAADQIVDIDHFSTTNRFYGFQVGGQFRREFGPFYLGDFGQVPYRFFIAGYGKVGLGLTDETVNISGSTTLTDPLMADQTVPGGILAQPSNIGDHHRVAFGFVPEMGLKFGFEITQHFRVESGYSCLMWNSVVRPGTSIDRKVNPGQVPSDLAFGTVSGPANPAFAFRDDWFWIHNFYFGLEVRY